MNFKEFIQKRNLNKFFKINFLIYFQELHVLIGNEITNILLIIFKKWNFFHLH